MMNNLFAAAVVACFVIECAANALFGFRSVGGFENFIGAVLAGAGCVAIAIIGAHQAAALRDYGWHNPKLYAIGLFVAACFLFGWVAGVRLYATNMADGGLRREREATKGSLARDKLQARRDERSRLGVRPAPEIIEAEIAKALGVYITKADKTVAAATSDCTDPSWAPRTCATVRDLRVKLADAVRAKALDAEIEDAAGKVGAAPVVAAGEPDIKALSALTLGAIDVKFWLPIFVVTLMQAAAIFGPAMVVGGHGRPASAPRDPMRLAYHGDGDGGARTIPGPPNGGGGGGGGYGAGPGLGYGPGATSSSAPINITFGAASAYPQEPRQATSAATVAGAAPAPVLALPAPRSEPPRGVIVGGARRDLAALPADGPPVDRLLAAAVSDGEREPADVLLAFRAACLVDAPGAMLPLSQLYERYRAWVGDRAISAPAFDGLLGVIGIHVVSVAGVRHAAAVAMKAVTLKAVG